MEYRWWIIEQEFDHYVISNGKETIRVDTVQEAKAEIDAIEDQKTMNRPTRFYSNKQEKAVAKAIAGKQVANSGATAFCKGDVKAENWLVECKTCTSAKASFSIKREWLTKNKEEAFAMGKDHNALCFDFGNGSQRYYVIDEKTFIKMKEALDVYEN